MAGGESVTPSAARSAAGKAKRVGLTPAGREKLRQVALATRPWEHATGPRTPARKAAAARNGKRRQAGAVSVRELRAELAGLQALVWGMADVRRLAAAAAEPRDRLPGRAGG